MQMNKFHQELKNQTMPLHDRLEALELPKKLVDETISKDEYITYLLKLYALHYKIESQLQAFEWSKFNIEIASYLRLELIEKDLQHLGATPPKEIDNGIEIASFDEAIGHLYVLTGSTMGGVILSQKVQKLFHGANLYFSGFGDETHGRWMQFLASLTRYTQENGRSNQEAIIKGAINCYRLVEKELDAQSKI